MTLFTSLMITFTPTTHLNSDWPSGMYLSEFGNQQPRYRLAQSFPFSLFQFKYIHTGWTNQLGCSSMVSCHKVKYIDVTNRYVHGHNYKSHIKATIFSYFHFLLLRFKIHNYSDVKGLVLFVYVTSVYSLWPLLLTWFNFNPSMDK